MDITDFYDTFFEEAEELLADMERYLLELDVDEPDSEQLNAIFRAAHSIKGGAGTFGFDALQKTTHLFENLLDHTRKGELRLPEAINSGRTAASFGCVGISSIPFWKPRTCSAIS